jgi:SpoVK/Ycf46/Vps4 family AAA+-type ATPase
MVKTPEQILFQPELSNAVATVMSLPGTPHLCIAGPVGCGQGLATRALAQARATAKAVEHLVVVDLLASEVSTQDSTAAVDRLRSRWSEAGNGVLRIDELELILANPTATAFLDALRNLIVHAGADDPVVVLCGDKESVAQLHALNPDLHQHFHHTMVRAFLSTELIMLLDRMIKQAGFSTSFDFVATTSPLIAKVRSVGNLTNARIPASLARHAIRRAAAAGRTSVQAEDIETAALRVIDVESGSAWAELDELIGLHDVKSTVRMWMSNSDLSERRERLGLITEGMSRHMVFKGPAGTAKTTVARIIGRILAENGVLSSGHLVETQRADFVGERVDQSPRLVVDAVKRSIGGVLFIDEAYSLTTKGDSSSENAEANGEIIKTLLKMMEDYREDFVVIVAGYVTEMEQFLNSNPGFRSRFAKTLEFPGYATSELFEILSHLAAKRGFVIDPGALGQLEPRLALVSQYPGFGNGRHMRNLLENAITRQGFRVDENATDDELRTLTYADFAEYQGL